MICVGGNPTPPPCSHSCERTVKQELQPKKRDSEAGQNRTPCWWTCYKEFGESKHDTNKVNCDEQNTTPQPNQRLDCLPADEFLSEPGSPLRQDGQSKPLGNAVQHKDRIVIAQDGALAFRVGSRPCLCHFCRDRDRMGLRPAILMVPRKHCAPSPSVAALAPTVFRRDAGISTMERGGFH